MAVLGPIDLASSPEAERRYAELRHVGEGVLQGTAMRYGSEAQFGDFREVFDAGAFEYEDVVLNVQHQRSRPIARTAPAGAPFLAGVLELQDDGKALEVRAKPVDATDGRDALALVRSGLLRGFSVEFVAIEERYEGNLRVVKRAALTGIAVVDRPAYDVAQVSYRMSRAAAAYSTGDPLRRALALQTETQRRRRWL